MAEPVPGRSFRLDNSEATFVGFDPNNPPRRISLTVTLPRPWWRRLLRRPAKTVYLGRFEVSAWPWERDGG